MGKYSDRAKIAAAKDYCQGTLGYKEVARRHGVNVASLRLWAAAYRVHGAVGVSSRKQRKYFSAEFKLSVIRRMEAEKLSIRQVAALFNIRNRDMIPLWQKAYEIGGIAALNPHSSIRYRAMGERIDRAPVGDDPEDDGKRTRQELLDEVRQLRMENAYLKKLEALAQADESARDKERKSCKS
jgi:transposase